ncbi:hypothetical protein [Faecalitalea cylindroides]|uniref:hypothetical protein n=1 Tax=Faecalitalea cylindroides TaxID=39483 RepID=UPI0039F5AD9E
MTKHDAVHSFIKKKIDELTEQTLGFNYSSEEVGQIAITTDFSDRVIKKYFIGAEKAYGFTITLIRPYSTDLDSLNLECMNFVQSFMDWIDEQNRKKNFPDFGESCQIKKMENLQNMPNLSGINPKEGLARYQIQCRIIYFDKEDK